MKLTLILLAVIVALVVALVIALYQMNLQKHYYEYASEKAENLEASLQEAKEETAQTSDQLNKVAFLNPISKVWNLEYFLSRQSEFFEKHKETKCTLVVFNISNLLAVNKLFGSSEGDAVIRFAADALRDMAQKKRGLYGHLYSNEFGLLLHSQDEAEWKDVVDSLQQQIVGFMENVELEPHFGVYPITRVGVSTMDRINRAVMAQNMVQKEDEQCFRIYTTEMEDQFVSNKKMSMEMEQALEDHKFLMYLQPMVDLKTFKIKSAEALVRWNHPEKGLLSPYAFLPLFEGTSMVEKLDYYMWEECCKTIRRWIDNKMAPTPISVNISPLHLESDKFIQKLDELTAHYLIDKQYMILEIPERGIANGSEDVKQLVRMASEHGYRLCIDNFGSLYSPLNLMRELPIESIKLDRSFINKNTENEQGYTILRYLIAMSVEVGHAVYVEGIETEEQANMLAEIGAEVAQGYFFSKPIDLREFDALNKTLINRVFRADEYYPTFEDLEKDLDLIEVLLKQTG